LKGLCLGAGGGRGVYAYIAGIDKLGLSRYATLGATTFFLSFWGIWAMALTTFFFFLEAAA